MTEELSNAKIWEKDECEILTDGEVEILSKQHDRRCPHRKQTMYYSDDYYENRNAFVTERERHYQINLAKDIRDKVSDKGELTYQKVLEFVKDYRHDDNISKERLAAMVLAVENELTLEMKQETLDRKIGLYEHNGRKNVRYYLADGTYKDHGRMIYESIPNKNDIIHPFTEVSYRVLDVKFPENDSCMEVYYEELPT